MDLYKEKKYISELIYKKIIGIASADELSFLEEWLKADDRNVILYNNILDKEGLKEDFSCLENVDANKMWRKLNIKEKKSVSFLPQVMRWAAVLVLLIGITSLFVLDFNKSEFADKNEKVPVIVPGTSKAKLIVEGGKEIALKDKELSLVANNKEVAINNGDSTVFKCQLGNKKKSVIHMHTLDIPAGGEYCIILSDGTKIWLNSKSRLRYPAVFAGNKRVVELVEGQAFFKVSKNKSKPFFVKAKNTLVKVTGTSFVVSAYKDDEYISTSLLEGGVDFSLLSKDNKEIDKVSIVPGMKAIVKANSIETKTVNVSNEISWLKGRFVFESEKLEDILKRMSRWYDFEVFYLNNNVRDELFTLDIRKYENADTFLNALEKIGDVKFRMKNRTLIVSHK